jgi:fructose-bisphosphate aldolase / 2-amino-3,7-dideoxy-D-threo-hept-6-ulosonate synthase
MVRGAMDAGAAGTSIGRNVFQHENPSGIVSALSAMVHGDASVDEAMTILTEGKPWSLDGNTVPMGMGIPASPMLEAVA